MPGDLITIDNPLGPTSGPTSGPTPKPQPKPNRRSKKKQRSPILSSTEPLARRQNRHVALRVQELANNGESPVDIMLDNMLFWHHHAKEMTEKLHAAVVHLDNDESIADAMKILREVLASRQHAQDCAVDAAPYCHPKFHSIEYKMPEAQISAEALPADAVDASVAYQRLIMGQK